MALKSSFVDHKEDERIDGNQEGVVHACVGGHEEYVTLGAQFDDIISVDANCEDKYSS